MPQSLLVPPFSRQCRALSIFVYAFFIQRVYVNFYSKFCTCCALQTFFVPLVNLRFTIKFCFTKLAACQFLLTHFFTDFAKSQFVAIFHSICFCALILAWVRDKWQGKGRRFGKSEMDKVLWVETDFSRILIMHMFLAIFHWICICRMVLTLICNK